MVEDTFHFLIEEADLPRIHLDHAYMVGRQGRGVAASFELDRTRRRLACRIPHHGGTGATAALVLQVGLPEIGLLKLRTTQLPPRAQPYALMIELARERLRHFLQKCEDWQMFAPHLAGPAMERFQSAREELAEAVLCEDRARRMALARGAIVKAVQAGEQLATHRADLVLHQRYGSSTATDTTLGHRIDPRIDPPGTLPPALEEFGVTMIETPLDLLQPRPGEYRFEALDRWMAWAAEHRLPVILGPVLDLRPEVLPDWARERCTSYPELCTLIWEHAERLLERYDAGAAIWCVSSGIHVTRLLALTDEQMIDLTRRLSVLVRQVDRSAKVLVELLHPFDDDVALRPGSVPAYEFATRTLDEGVHVDCFGLNLRCGFPEGGGEVRDLLSLSDALDRFAGLERPLLVTGLSAPRRSGDLLGGSWHTDWSEDRQAQWGTSMMGITLGKMTVRGESARSRPTGAYEGVLWSDLLDGPVEPTGLVGPSGSPRKILTQLATVRHALRRPLRSGPTAESPASTGTEGTEPA